MALETVTYVGDLVPTNPTSSDQKSAGDDHLRNLKAALLATLSGFAGAALATGVDGGAVNVYTLTPATALPSYVTKMLAEFTPITTSTGPATLNISALGAKPIVTQAGVAIAAGDLVSGCTYLAAYDGASFRLISVTTSYVDAVRAYAGTVHDYADSLIAASLPGFAGATAVTGTDGGLVNAYTLTPSDAITTYDSRMVALFSPVSTNSGAVTLSISGLGAKSVLSVSGAALVAGDLVIGNIYAAVYNGTEFRLLSVTKNYTDQLAFGSALPTQTGNAGKFVGTNGATASWQVIVGNSLYINANLGGF